MDDLETWQVEKEDVKEEIKKSNKFLIIGIIAAALIILIVVISFFPSNDQKGISPGANDTQEDSKGVLSSIFPKKDSGETTPDKKNLTAAGGAEGGGGGEESEGEEEIENEEMLSSAGKLRVTNRISSYSGASGSVIHWQGASESLDDYDGRYYAMFTPSGITGKIVSTVEGTELDADSRPIDSMSSVELELSLVSQSGGP